MGFFFFFFEEKKISRVQFLKLQDEIYLVKSHLGARPPLAEGKKKTFGPRPNEKNFIDYIYIYIYIYIYSVAPLSSKNLNLSL